MQSRFADMTKEMQKDLPKWFKMRKDPNSVGAQFLNAFGLQFDDIKFYLQYALDNQYIGTADVQQIDVIYKSTIPSSLNGELNYVMIGDGSRLQEMKNLKEFFEGIDTRFLERKEIYYPNPFYVDWERNVVYFKKTYGKNETFTEGVVSLRIYDENDSLMFEHDMPQYVHHVWNFFDEFGLLLDTPRLYAEKNIKYKERLLDVFRHPANSTKKGLQFLLARELDLWKEVIWPDASVDLTIKYSNVILETIERDGIPIMPDSAVIDKSGRVVLQGDPEQEGVMQKVRFISGLQMHTFHNKKDYAFQEDLYSVDRVATPMLQYYVDIITNKVPVMWDHFIWNESFWDIADKEMSGYGFLPGYNDARFLNWAKYKG